MRWAWIELDRRTADGPESGILSNGTFIEIMDRGLMFLKIGDLVLD